MALLLRDASACPTRRSPTRWRSGWEWLIYKAREEVQLALAREGITFGARAEEAELAGAEIVA